MRDLPFRRRGCYIDNPTFFPDDRPGARPAIAPTIGAGSAPGIFFGGMGTPSTDFQAVRDQRRTTPLWFLVDLSIARSIAAGSAVVLPLQGNSLYADPLQDASGSNIAGYATLHFADTSLNPQGTPITVGPQFIAKVPFTQLLLENIAQPGKFLRIIYGVDIDFSPGLNASVTIGGTVIVQDQGYTYGAAYKSITVMAANTPEQIFSPAANVNGAILWEAGWYSESAAGITQAGMLAKTAAPATIIDGDVIVGTDTYTQTAANRAGQGKLARPVKIAAGKGLYYINTVLDVAPYRYALYTLT